MDLRDKDDMNECLIINELLTSLGAKSTGCVLASYRERLELDHHGLCYQTSGES